MALRNKKGQGIIEGGAAIVLIISVTVGALALLVDIGTSVFFKDKLGLICNQLALKFSGFAGDVSALPTGQLQSEAVALGSALGLTINPSDVTATSITSGSDTLLKVSIEAKAPLVFKVFGAVVPISDFGVALNGVATFNNNLNAFNNYNAVLLIPTPNGQAMYPGFLNAPLPPTLSSGGAVSVCLIQAAGGGAPALGQFGAPGIGAFIEVPQ